MSVCLSVQRQRQAEEDAKKAEVEALQQQIAQMKALQAAVPNNVQSKKPGGKVRVKVRADMILRMSMSIYP